MSGFFYLCVSFCYILRTFFISMCIVISLYNIVNEKNGKRGFEMWIKHNANPKKNRVGDCTVRAICTALNKSWYEVYVALAIEGFIQCNIAVADNVWGAYLEKQNFERKLVDADCMECYSVDKFCSEHPNGIYILSISGQNGGSGHVVAAINGNFFDTWNSSEEIVLYFWKRKE